MNVCLVLLVVTAYTTASVIDVYWNSCKTLKKHTKVKLAVVSGIVYRRMDLIQNNVTVTIGICSSKSLTKIWATKKIVSNQYAYTKSKNNHSWTYKCGTKCIFMRNTRVNKKDAMALIFGGISVDTSEISDIYIELNLGGGGKPMSLEYTMLETIIPKSFNYARLAWGVVPGFVLAILSYIIKRRHSAMKRKASEDIYESLPECECENPITYDNRYAFSYNYSNDSYDGVNDSHEGTAV